MRIAVTSVVDLERVAHNRLHEFLEYLSKKHEVTVFGIQDYWRERQVDSALYAAGFEDLLTRIKIVPYTERRVSPIFQEALGAHNATRLIREHGPFDIHYDYNTLLSGGAFGKEFRRLKVPTVYDLADDLVAMIRASPQIPRPARSIVGALAARALRKNLDNAAAVTVINATLGRDADVTPEKLCILPNGVDTVMFSPEGPSKRSELGLEKHFVLGYVGVLREWVDFEPVLNALKAIREAPASGLPLKLVVVGEEGGKARISQRAKELGVLDDVLFVGTVPYPEVPSYVRAIDAGLIPFNPGKIGANSLPLKLFEYMSVGKPVISTPLPGVMECAGERATYALSPEEYVRAIQKLSRSSVSVAENLEWVRSNYSWEAAARALERALEGAAQ